MVEAVSEGRGNFFPGDGLTGFRVPVFVVSDKGRRVSFFAAGIFDGEINVGNDGGFEDLGGSVDVRFDLCLDEGSQIHIPGGFLGNTSFPDDDRTGGGKEHRRR